MAAKKTKAKKGARKSTMTKKRKSASKSDAVAARFKKLSVISLIGLLALWGIGWFVLSGGPAKVATSASNQMLSVSANSGFEVKNILVEGREFTDADVLLALINVGEGDPLFSFDPAEAKEQIERIGWVKSAHVERRLPDTIYIRLIEREPIALWQRFGALSLVDSEGTLITGEGLDRFKHLPMILGKNAPVKTADLMSMLGQYPEFKALLDHAELIDGRRWDLFLKDEKRVKLPEKNTLDAIKHIMVRHEEDQILDKKAIIDIDARYKQRLIVRTRLGTVQDYKADFHTIGTQP